MNIFSNMVFYIMNILKVIGMICLGLVMLVVTVGVISRLLGHPLLGTVELAEIIHFVGYPFCFRVYPIQKGAYFYRLVS